MCSTCANFLITNNSAGEVCCHKDFISKFKIIPQFIFYKGFIFYRWREAGFFAAYILQLQESSLRLLLVIKKFA